jgi:2-polyprenyl-6-methoxyphenol hydroxylase-like FAD-dependent oxidoreductase
MSLDSSDVVVVGAGPGGAAAALLLARSGASVTLLDRVPGPDAGRTGILIGPAGMAVLTALRLGLRRRTGTTAFRYAEVAGALLAAVNAERAIAYRSAATVHAASPAGSVLLDWHDRESTIDADLVVGADGSASVVRAGGRFQVSRADVTVTYVSGLVPRDGPEIGSERVTPLGRCGGGPVDARTAYFYAAADAPAVAVALARHDVAEVGRLWSIADPAAGAAIARAAAGPALRTETFTPVVCGRSRDGRLVLIGGAVRSTAGGFPLRAQAALVDAANLIDTLVSGKPQASSEASSEGEQ